MTDSKHWNMLSPGFATSHHAGFAVMPQHATSPRAGFAVTPQYTTNPPANFAVMPQHATSPRAGFAVTPQYTTNPPANFAVMPQHATSPRAGFAVTPQYTTNPPANFAVMPPQHATSPQAGFAMTPQRATDVVPINWALAVSAIPERLREVVYKELGSTVPQRATDIFYQDGDEVYVMRTGVQYRLTPPASQVWLKLGENTIEDIINIMAGEVSTSDRDKLRSAVFAFLLNSAQNDLVILYPKPASKENLSPVQK
jgi:hypothetical protein